VEHPCHHLALALHDQNDFFLRDARRFPRSASLRIRIDPGSRRPFSICRSIFGVILATRSNLAWPYTAELGVLSSCQLNDRPKTLAASHTGKRFIDLIQPDMLRHHIVER
jgi:hypothetical protein